MVAEAAAELVVTENHQEQLLVAILQVQKVLVFLV
jgi:hypothetical protein